MTGQVFKSTELETPRCPQAAQRGGGIPVAFSRSAASGPTHATAQLSEPTDNQKGSADA
jgi:hypothetical protein